MKGGFSMPICSRKQTNVPPGNDHSFLQPTATAAMHCHPEGCTHPPPPFLLAQNLSSQEIAPTDNMQPNRMTPKSVIVG